MITEEKIKDVRKMIKRGIPEGEIKEELRQTGYTKDDIDKAFAPRPYDMRSWYLTFAIIFLLVGAWLYFQNQNKIILAFSVFLFIQYYRETGRLKSKEREVDTDNITTNNKGQS